MELEAEEEEEEGRQAGLGDFGFGRVDFNQDDEAVGECLLEFQLFFV